MMATTALTKTVHWSYDDTLLEVMEALKAEGFGVLTQIDLRETLRSKLGATLPRYTILGACNPPLAYRALQAELDAGLMMPCNVIVYEAGDRTVVKAIDPGATLAASNAALQPIAEEVRTKLELVLARLA